MLYSSRRELGISGRLGDRSWLPSQRHGISRYKMALTLCLVAQTCHVRQPTAVQPTKQLVPSLDVAPDTRHKWTTIAPSEARDHILYVMVAT